MSGGPTAGNTDLVEAPTVRIGGQTSTDMVEPPNGSRTVASAADREAILAELYRDRHVLTREQRLGDATESDASRLRDIEREIARWEAQELPARSVDPLWQQIDALAHRVLKLHGKSDA